MIKKFKIFENQINILKFPKYYNFILDENKKMKLTTIDCIFYRKDYL